MKAHSRVKATVNLDIVRENIFHIKYSLKPNTKILAVVKADAYGHGAIPIAKSLMELEYIWGFATATTEEAMELRQSGIEKPILILGYTFIEDYEELVNQDIRPTVFQLQTAQELSKVAVRLKKTVYLHLALDTGMSRIGYKDTRESISSIKEIMQLPNIKIEGLFTHFAKADEADISSAYGQLDRYSNFVDLLSQEGISIPIKHCSNSAGIIRVPEANLDFVRAGITIYGLEPSSNVDRETVPFHPVLTLTSHISYVKEVEKGIGISYGGTFVTSKKTRVATVPVGYADGYPRGLSNKGYVLIHDKKAPILGRICMDQFMVDVTNIPQAKALDQVTLIGRDINNSISVEELGKLSGRFNYEFVCDINKRVPRVYVQKGEVVEQKDYFRIE